jgi:MFS family permease
MMATGPAIIQDSFPPEQLGRSLGLVGVSVSLGLMSGPGLGGLLIQWLSWRALFYLTVPIGLLFSLLAVRYLPRLGAGSTTAAAPIDWSGSLLLAATLCLFTLMLTGLTDRSWTTAAILLTILPLPPLLYRFIATERNSPHPLLPLDVFGDRYFRLGIVSVVLSFTTLFSAIILTPFYLDRVRQMSPAATGLIMMAIPATIMLMSPLAGYLSDHLDKSRLATLGLLISSAGLFLLSATGPEANLSTFTVHLALLGCGQSIFLSPNSAAVLAHCPRNRTGTAAALLATARNLGMLLGIALATLVFTIIFSRHTGGLDLKDFTADQTLAFLAAWRGSMLTAGGIGVLGILASGLRGQSPGRVIPAADSSA